ncbi:hypothetical protein PRIPAC_87928, partial [Pristionchus pacificus]
LGVDPFALLKSCEGAKRKLTGDIADQFKQLRARFDGCVKKRLVQQTIELFDGRKVTLCTLCDVNVVSTNNMIAHCCGKAHLEEAGGVACADAFDFWWSAVREATVAQPEPEIAAKPEPAFSVRKTDAEVLAMLRPEPAAAEEEWPESALDPESNPWAYQPEPTVSFYSRPWRGERQPPFAAKPEEFPSLSNKPKQPAVEAAQPIAGAWARSRTGPPTGARPKPEAWPDIAAAAEAQKRGVVSAARGVDPRNVPGLAILRRAERVDQPCVNPRAALTRVLSAFKKCDNRKLNTDPTTVPFFVKPLLCQICDRCYIDNASNLVTHITGNAHDAQGELPRVPSSYRFLDVSGAARVQSGPLQTPSLFLI